MTSAELATTGVHERERPVAAAPARADKPCGRRAPDAVRDYLHSLMQDLAEPDLQTEPVAAAGLPERIFAIQTHREFCYLSRGRAAAFGDSARRRIAQSLDRGLPVQYCLDIGGGYHASLRPGAEPLSFGPGLGELLLLRQIRRLEARVRRVYRPGLRFSLVIDNLVAWFVNGIPVESTAEYCARLRALIAQSGMSALVDLWVESEHLTTGDFERLRPAHRVEPCLDALTRKDHETVERFLGRRCDVAEAAARAASYREITAVSTALIDSRIDGLRMTQRATRETLCFRPVPGADSRIQSGEVALCTAGHGRVRPLLLTSHNEHLYEWHRIDISAMLPPAIEQVIYADPAVRAPA